MKKGGKAQRLESLVAVSPMSTSIADEADRLFPAFRVPPGEPKLRPPQEYLGRNPFSELKRRAEHASNLAALDKETQAKIKESQDLLAARKSANENLLHPTPLTISSATETECVGYHAHTSGNTGGGKGSASLPPLRSAPSTAITTGTVGTSASSVCASPVSSSYWASSTAVEANNPWAAGQGVAPTPPTVSDEDAKGSRSQLMKHKFEKHRGYFGRALLEARTAVDDTPRVVHFTPSVDRLLVMHPSISNVDVFTNTPWSLDAFSMIDGVGLKMLFGKDVVPLMRANGQLCRTPDACPKGNPASDPPLFLPGLHVALSGKPGAGWPGDAASVVLTLSRYAYTMKSASVETSCKAYPNVFYRFGVDGGALELASPFPMRFLDGATSMAPQDVSRLNLSYHAKTRMRVVEAAFVLPLFQGYVESDAQLIVSGQLRSNHNDDGDRYEPDSGEGEEAEASSPGHGKQDEHRADSVTATTTRTTVQLIMDIPDHVEQFSFRGAAAQLAFLDVISSTHRRFTIVQQQPHHPLPSGGGLQSRLDVSLLWNIRKVPLLLKLFGNDPTIAMTGRLVREGPKRSVLRSASPSTRSCTLWDFVKLKHIVAFIECEETVSIYGVDCVAEIEVANGTGGKSILAFEGRLCATIAESAQSLFTPDAAYATLVRPADFMFEGSLSDSAWNCVAGVPFVHLLQPILRFAVNATTLLPLSIAVHGTPVLQMADPGVGLSSDHGFKWAPGSGTVVFPVDALPHYVLRAPLTAALTRTTTTTTSQEDPTTTTLPTTTLKELLVSLFHPDVVASFSSGTAADASSSDNDVSSVLQAAHRVAFTDAEFVVNEDRTEAVVGATGPSSLVSSAVTVRRYPPGIWICADAAKVEMLGAKYRARGNYELKYEREASMDPSSQLTSVVIHGTLSLLSRIQGAHGLSIGSSGATGVGPNCVMTFRIGGGHGSEGASLPTTASSVEWALKDAVVAVAGLGAAPCSTLSLTVGPGHGDERVSQLSLAALFVPPMIQLENAHPSVLEASIAPRKESNRSIHDALRLFYALNLSLRSSHGHFTHERPRVVHELPSTSSASLNSRRLLSKMVWDIASSNVATPLRCGIQEAILDVFVGKVAELRATCTTTVRALHIQIAEAMARHAALQDELRIAREPIVAASTRDVKSLQQALTAVTAESSKLAHRWTDEYWRRRIEVGHIDAAASASSQVAALQQQRASSSQSDGYSAYLVVEHQRQAGTARSRLSSARYMSIATGLSLMGQALMNATKAGIGASLDAYAGLSTVADNNAAFPSEGGDGRCTVHGTGHGATMQYIKDVELERLAQFVAVTQETVDAFQVVVQQLQGDEAVFASLFKILDISVHGGMRGNDDDASYPPRNRPCHDTPPSMNTFLSISGIVRQRPFRVLQPLPVLDHSTLMAVVDNTTTEMLQLYLSLLRFS